MLRRLCWMGFVAAVVVVWTADARGHHPSTQGPLPAATPRSRAEAQVQVAGFDFGSWAGTWVALVAAGEYAVSERAAVRARVPVVYIDYQGRDSVSGLGDVEMEVKVLVLRAADGAVDVSVGLGGELPTGDEDHGLGSGHFELAPFAAAALRGRTWQLSAVVGDRIGLDGHDHGDHDHAGGDHDHVGGDHDHPGAGDQLHGSVLAPHSDHELFAHVAATAVRGPLYGSAIAEPIYSFSDAEAVLSAGFEVGFLATERVQLSAGFELPIAGPDRFTWRAHSSATWLF